MAMMNAAVVTSFEEPPHYQRFEVPHPHGSEEALVDVLAAGLHPRVRSGAAGAHYTSTGTLGAGRVVGAGRDLGRLDALTPAGADDIVQLTADSDATGAALAAAAADTDIVID